MKKHILSAMVVLGIALAFVIVIYDITQASQSEYQKAEIDQLTVQNNLANRDDKPED